MSAKRASAASASKKPNVGRASGRPAATSPAETPLARWALWLLGAGLVVGVLGVPSAMWLALRNPFGPPKALALALAAGLALVGLALAPGALPALAGAIRRSRLAWTLGALVGLAVLATLTAIDVRQALLGGYPDYRGLVSILAYAAVGLAAFEMWRRDAGALRLGRLGVACAGVVGGVGVLQRAGIVPPGAPGSFGSGWRVSSTLGNSSNLGVFLVVLLPLVVWIALRDRSRAWRVIAWVAFALGALSLVWTLSRGAWVAAIVEAGLGVVLLVWQRKLVSRRIGWVLGFVAVALVIGVALTPTFASRASVLLASDSSTAQWRLSTWRSAATMTLSRPFLGFGPNQFRFAYPAFEAPGQIDGRTGYPVVEAAHNLEADTATSFGLLGLLALLAAGVLAGMIVARSQIRDDGGDGLPVALGLALLGGGVALQFHYVTMDTGPILAVVLAGLVSIDAAQRLAETPSAVAAPWLAPARAIALALGAIYVGMAVAAGGAIGADRAAARAMTLVRAGAPWPAVSAELTRADSLAPWETQIIRARGTVATAAVTKRFDSAAAADGIRAFDAAVAMTPADAVLGAERGNLLLAAGIAAHDRTLLERAAMAFADVERMDPNTGIAGAGRGSALLALGQVDEAIAELERAMTLSPRYAAGWSNLAMAYRAAGRSLDEQRAAARAKKWAR